ncbi:MAG: hypothetical protein AAGI91_09090 [Bacteroidota bacterium]
MNKALRKRVRVQPGGRIELQDDALPAGTDAEVIILLPEPSGDGAPPDETATPSSLDDLPTAAELEPLPPLPLDQAFGIAPSGRTADEIDRDLRALRDEWDEPFARREQGPS